MWVITEPVKEALDAIYISKEENLKLCMSGINRNIIDTDEFKLALVYQNPTRMVGYKFTYKSKKLKSFSKLHNSVVWFFSPDNKSEIKLEVMYEDQNIRLLTYQRGKFNDYWVVGRWREEKEVE